MKTDWKRLRGVHAAEREIAKLGAERRELEVRIAAAHERLCDELRGVGTGRPVQPSTAVVEQEVVPAVFGGGQYGKSAGRSGRSFIRALLRGSLL